MDDFKNYIKNKSLIIVGPSPSLIGKKLGNFIDSFDVIFRIKKSFPVPKEYEVDLGTKTDVLISHLKISSRNYNQNNFKNYKAKIFNNNLKYIYFPYPLYKHFIRFKNEFTKECPKIKVPIITQDNQKKFLKLYNDLDNNDPTAFLASIFSLLDYDIKDIYITGITFQKDGFLNYYKTKKEDESCVLRTKKVHNMDNEFKYFKKLVNLEKRIKLDTYLDKIISPTNIMSTEKIVCVSGYFDPIHIGHIEFFKKSRNIGDKLMVIVNNDEQAKLKKGKQFMDLKERVAIIKELRCVDYVRESIDTDRTVCKTLDTIEPKPHFFCNGGDQNNNTIPETELCIKNNIELRDGFGDKIQSSSWLIKNSKK